jgi:hypothetical protein
MYGTRSACIIILDGVLFPILCPVKMYGRQSPKKQVSDILDSEKFSPSITS